MHFMSYDGDGTVNVHHHIVNPDQTTTTHTGKVTLKSLRYQQVDTDTTNEHIIVIACPIDGCDTTSYVPIDGGTEAQLLHASVHHAHKKGKTLGASVDVIREKVKTMGRHPYINDAAFDEKTGKANALPHSLLPRTEVMQEPDEQLDFVGIRTLLRNATPEERQTLIPLFKRMQEQEAK